MMLITGLILAFFFLLATIVPLLKISSWYVRVFDFPRLQIVAMGVVAIIILLVASLTFWVFIIAGVIVVGIVYQVKTILPYTKFTRRQVKSARNLKPENNFSMVICNVKMDNKDNPKCLERVLESDADVLFFVETDDWWAEHLKVLEKTHPIMVKCPQGNTYGMLLYSKLVLYDTEIEYLMSGDVPSIHTKIVLPSGKDVQLYLLHPRPPVPGLGGSSVNRDAELLTVGKRVRMGRKPVVVGGDLNDVAWSRTTTLFQKISRLLDPRIGRGFYNTFHAKYPILRWPLDHVFHSAHFSLVDLKRLKYTGSDHFPIYVRLQLEEDSQEKNGLDRPDKEDLQEIYNKIQRGKQTSV